MTGVVAQPPYLSVYAEQLATVAGDVRRATTTLTEQLAGLGDYCGTDEDAVGFKAAYDPVLHDAEDAMSTTVVGRLTTISGVLEEMARRFAGEDAETAAALRKASPGDHFTG